jgi:small subunit ribosomal protein S21
VQDGETLESALRRFKRKVQQEDIIKEIKRHSFHLKPGEKKRTKEALAQSEIARNAIRKSSSSPPMAPVVAGVLPFLIPNTIRKTGTMNVLWA